MRKALIAGAIMSAAAFATLPFRAESAPAGPKTSGEGAGEPGLQRLAANEQKPASDAKAPPVSSEPETTTAAFADWILRCQKTAEAARFCEIVETIVVEGQRVPIAQAAIGKAQKDKPYQLTVVLPVDVQFGGAPQVALEGEASSAIDLTWRKCVPAGCFADVTLSEPALAALRNAKNRAFIRWRNNLGQQIQLGMSLRGLTQAYAELAKERS